jgi:peptidoglycan/LPS O-acetylase OafA/YrhL
LPFNYAYSITTYFVSAALFVFCKYHLCDIKRTGFRNIITRVSAISFGIYWVHIAVLDLLVPRLLPVSMNPALGVMAKFILTVAISIFVMLPIKKVPKINRFVM